MRQKGGGTGLGLYLSAQIAERMGGCIDASCSDTGETRGCRFTLVLPVRVLVRRARGRSDSGGGAWESQQPCQPPQPLPSPPEAAAAAPPMQPTAAVAAPPGVQPTALLVVDDVAR